MQFTITTRYKTHPNSNVGRSEATLRHTGGNKIGTRSVRNNQALNNKDNHRRAADKIAADFTVIIDDNGEATDDGYVFQAHA